MRLCRIHYFRWLPNTDRAYCYLSRVRNTDTAIVFVHGFLGNCVDTWQHFPTLVDELGDGVSWWATCDLYFWNYPSAEQTINQSAFQLREFLKRIVPAPHTQLMSLASGTRPTDQEYIRKPSEYEHLILVGHSLGGVVIRQSIVDIIKQWEGEGKPVMSLAGIPTFFGSVLGAELHLFSPALHGTSFMGLPGIIYEFPATRWLFELLLKTSSPSYKQLNTPSVSLAALEEATNGYNLRYGFPALSARIYYAGDDRIVSDLVYASDPPATYIPDQTHASVCKPCSGYLQPLELIQRAPFRNASAT